MINQDLLKIMVCPLCKSDIRLWVDAERHPAVAGEGDAIHCTNQECGCRYRIEGDIPVMLIDEANRPCPKCGKQRDWKEAEGILNCPQCGNVFKPTIQV